MNDQQNERTQLQSQSTTGRLTSDSEKEHVKAYYRNWLKCTTVTIKNQQIYRDLRVESRFVGIRLKVGAYVRHVTSLAVGKVLNNVQFAQHCRHRSSQFSIKIW